jgi:hypothetical protein
VTDTSDEPEKASELPWITDAVAGPLAAGAACEIKATGNAVGNQLTQQAVVAVH